MDSVLEIDKIEKHFGFQFPERHRMALLNSSDLIHDLCDFLLPNRTDKMLGLIEQNESLRGNSFDPWPSYLLAFASNGFGDYFAYDLRSDPAPILYIDPDCTVAESLSRKNKDILRYDDFESWYHSYFKNPRR